MVKNDLIIIKKAEATDVDVLFDYIKQLAVFEKAPNEVTNTKARMLAEGFGEKPAFDAFIALRDDEAVGIAITYFRYSTWKGCRLYLEDLIVSEVNRGKGIGRLLFDYVVSYAKTQDCSGVTFQVLDWNKPAIDFYETYGVSFDAEWINCNLNF